MLLRRCRIGVATDDLESISIAMAAKPVNEDLRVVCVGDAHLPHQDGRLEGAAVSASA